LIVNEVQLATQKHSIFKKVVSHFSNSFKAIEGTDAIGSEGCDVGLRIVGTNARSEEGSVVVVSLSQPHRVPADINNDVKTVLEDVFINIIKLTR
jgi:hypothetical protein